MSIRSSAMDISSFTRSHGIATGIRAVRITRLALVALGLTAILPAMHATAQTAESAALSRILSTGKVVIGHRQGELPFSYMVGEEVVGYTTDICLRIVDEIRDHLKLERLDVQYIPVTAATRFVYIKSGKIDLECAATTNNAERRELAEFAFPHFVTSTRFVSRKADGIRTIRDLAGRSVAATTGTINVEQLNALNRSMNLNISVLLSREHSDAFAQVESGKASAFVMDDILLAGLVASSANPQEFVISDEALSRPEPYGIMMHHGDMAFKTIVNEALRKIYTSGEIMKIYDKWFMKPVPPAGTNMNLPMSAELRERFLSPQEYRD